MISFCVLMKTCDNHYQLVVFQCRIPCHGEFSYRSVASSNDGCFACFLHMQNAELDLPAFAIPGYSGPQKHWLLQLLNLQCRATCHRAISYRSVASSNDGCVACFLHCIYAELELPAFDIPDYSGPGKHRLLLLSATAKLPNSEGLISAPTKAHVAELMRMALIWNKSRPGLSPTANH